MSGTLNKVMLIGHLGDDVKMNYFEGGNCLGRFPLATNETYTNRQTGERVTNTEWHNIVVRNKAAEVCEKYLKKGDKVYVEGRLKTRQWQGEDGNMRYTTEVHVTDFTFLSNKPEPGSNPGAYGGASTSSEAPTQARPVQNSPSSPSLSQEEEDDDLPF
ncbi:single-stranded DNA-binding protein [Robertkochia marina]|uniref:Single-stranded DNA-binding protein n=1 Tax=Robertkochia marina TaxID=1227945 RepID=A0A4S3M3A9_9FLAO|nr:single-stranded DNA-binding protein [Robertkochia marina]THD69553.1 single-stranded DNA-binding protein [Robertkochia marina]TRZ47190.1 single-stranded DNA-binding protein [Robertkochia marina]